MTQVTASSLHVGNVLIALGRVSFALCDQRGAPVPFRSGVGVYGRDPFVATVVNGAIQDPFSIPDLLTVVPLESRVNASYTITVLDTDRAQAWKLTGVTEVTGPSWSLDGYTPASAAPVSPAAFSSGTGLPHPHPSADPALYLRLDKQQIYACFGGTWVAIGEAQQPVSESTDAEGIFVEAVSALQAVCALPSGFGLAKTTERIRSAVGVAPFGVPASATGTVRTMGRITDSGWNWTLGKPVFVGPLGLLTQTAPTTGFIQVIGRPLSSDTLLLRVGEPTFFA